jgi:uncharacterized protein
MLDVNPSVHFEIGCRDLAATKEVYQKMFDWPIDGNFQIAEARLAGHLVSLGHEPQHYTMFYVEVDDVAQAIAKAESLGGRKLVGPVTIPTGTFAWIMDTQQNTLGSGSRSSGQARSVEQRLQTSMARCDPRIACRPSAPRPARLEREHVPHPGPRRATSITPRLDICATCWQLSLRHRISRRLKFRHLRCKRKR